MCVSGPLPFELSARCSICEKKGAYDVSDISGEEDDWMCQACVDDAGIPTCEEDA